MMILRVGWSGFAQKGKKSGGKPTFLTPELINVEIVISQ
jgi:hypothetical protein